MPDMPDMPDMPAIGAVDAVTATMAHIRLSISATATQRARSDKRAIPLTAGKSMGMNDTECQ